MNRMNTITTVVVLTVFLSNPPRLSGQAHFTPLGAFPGDEFESRAFAVSADGTTVVGGSASAPWDLTAFRWTTEGGMVAMGFLPGGYTGSEAWGTSADGSVIVGWSHAGGSGHNDKSFRWTAEEGMVSLHGGSPFLRGGAYDTSSDGSVVVGFGIDSQFVEAYRWTEVTGMVGLGNVPGGSPPGSIARAVSSDGSVVAGQGNGAGSGQEAFRWTEAEGMIGLGDLPGGIFNSEAHDISADGSVIVGESTTTVDSEAFRWTEATGMVSLGAYPDGDGRSAARAVSADGSIIVGHSYTDIAAEAFVWDADNGMRNLREILTSAYGLDLKDWLLHRAHDISADGLTIVGTAFNPSGQYEAFLVTLPDCNGNGTADDSDISLGTSDDSNDNGIPDECESISLPLDIRPGACPNPFNRHGNGVLPVALVGSAEFDPTEVDLSSLQLSRADGVGGSVAPNEGPPGPHSVFEDVATPFEGEACECHDLGGDNIDDLSMKFRTDELVEALELDALPGGAVVELVLSGSLLAGTPFQASDCIVILPPGDTSPANAHVESNVPDTFVEIGPLDLNFGDDGFADFSRSYYGGTAMTLTAPVRSAGRRFVRWLVDGAPQPSGMRTIEVLVSEDTTLKAVYARPARATPEQPAESDEPLE